MAQTIREVMTRNPVTLEADTALIQAARAMRDADIGDVVVTRDGKLCGLVTDRDIVVRALAEGRDPSSTRLEEICSADVTTVSPDDPVEVAIGFMKERSIRRLPVTQDGTVTGMVSIGDLAMERDQRSALADISAAPGNR